MALRRVAAVVIIVTVLLVQLSAVNRITTPAAAPDLILVVVLVLALLEGPAAGMAYGFGGGLLGDALSTHAFGRLALVWTIAGYLAGLMHDPGGRAGERSAALPLLGIGALCAASTLAYAALDVVVGAAHDAVYHLIRQAVAVGVYGVILAPFVYLLLRPALRRLEPNRG
jgi:rod shape-determining protein MreD